jgi:hypothetical protein
MIYQNVSLPLEIEQLACLLKLSSQLTRKKIRDFFTEHFCMERKLSHNKRDFCEEVLKLARDSSCISELIGVILGNKPTEFIPPDEWEFSRLVAVSTSVIHHEHFERGQDFVIENYNPNGRRICLFTLCTHTKPYRSSRTVQAIHKHLQSTCDIDNISIVFISTPGVVPYEFDSLYPFAYYEWNESQENPAVMSDYIDICIERLDRCFCQP